MLTRWASEQRTLANLGCEHWDLGLPRRAWLSCVSSSPMSHQGASLKFNSWRLSVDKRFYSMKVPSMAVLRRSFYQWECSEQKRGWHAQIFLGGEFKTGMRWGWHKWLLRSRDPISLGVQMASFRVREFSAVIALDMFSQAYFPQA